MRIGTTSRSFSVQATEGSRNGEQEERSDWSSIWIGSIVTFLTATQNSIYFSSLWPYLLQLDSTVTENFFGVIAATYSLGQTISSFLYGYWSSRIHQTKLPVMMGVFFTATGNMMYLLLPLNIAAPQYVMMASRAVMGCGAGIMAPLRASAVTASTAADRTRAMSINTGAFSLGLSIGPALQMLFTPLSFPGIRLVGFVRLNIYTGPAIGGLVANCVSMTLVHFAYRDSTVALHRVPKMENETHERFYALPKFDRIAAAVCLFTRFSVMIVISNLDTIGSPLSMTMFSWDGETAVFYNSLMHGAFSVVGFSLYAANTIFNFCQKLNQRMCCIIGLLLTITFHLLTYPWPFLSTKIKYQEETGIDGNEPVGCRRSFDWCATTPAINVYVYMISYSLIMSTAFAMLSVNMLTVYSTAIGPRNQGTMQGLIMFSGNCARLIGPILISNMFVRYGMSIPWIIEIVMTSIAVLLWVVFYRRLVPLRMQDSLSAGERYRSKHGMVYKF